MRLITSVIMAALLSTSMVSAKTPRPGVKTVPTAVQTLAVSVPENNGIVLRMYRVGSDGTMKKFARTRLAETNSGTYLQSLSFSPSGKFAYGCFFTNGSGKQKILQYRLEADGSLLPLPSLPVAASYIYEARGVYFAPHGQSAYILDRDGISQWQCRNTGELVPLRTAHVALGEPIQHHDLHHDITKPGDKFSTFEIENNDAVSPLEILFNSTGQYAYVLGHEHYYKGTEIVTSFGEHGGGQGVDEALFIIRYQVSANGELVSPTERLPLPITTSSVAFSLNGQIMYATDRQSKTITPYRLLPDGISLLSPSSAVPGESVCLDPHGRYAYVATAGAISQYRITDDGGLEPLVPGFVSVPTPEINGPHNPKFPPGQLRASLGGRFLFARYTNDTTVVAAYAIGNDGVLSAHPVSVVPVSGDYGFGEMAVLPGVSPRAPRTSVSAPLPLVSEESKQDRQTTAREFAYVLNFQDGTISQYRVCAGGTLSPLLPATVDVGQFRGNMAFDPSGKFCYVPGGVGGGVSLFRVSPDGTLTLLPSRPDKSLS
jgi:6-phosphogluconolactonase (cycloisomerase 2 family)